MDRNYFFNAEMNICATKEWLVDYLYYGGMVEDRETAYNALSYEGISNFFGWKVCHVSPDIEVVVHGSF